MTYNINVKKFTFRTKIVLPVRNNREPSSKYIKISNQDNEIKCVTIYS